MATKVTLQEATLHHCPIPLRSASGTSESTLTPLIVKSNTTWKLVKDASSSWLTLDPKLTSSDGINGDSIVNYTYTEFLSSEEFEVREAKIEVVVASDPDKILKVFYIRQQAAIYSLKFRPNASDGPELSDQFIGNQSGTLSFYIYAKSTSIEWYLMSPMLSQNPWITSATFNTSGQGTTQINISYDTNETLTDRYYELLLSNIANSSVISDVLIITQKAGVGAPAAVALASGLPGSWNATPQYDEVVIDHVSLPVDGSGNDTQLNAHEANKSRVRNLRRSAHSYTIDSGYYIVGDDTFLTDLDSTGNSTFSTGEENNLTSNNYKKSDRDRGNWNIESVITVPNGPAIPTTVFESAEQTIFSNEPVRNAINSTNGALFISNSLLFPDYSFTTEQIDGIDPMTPEDLKGAAETTVVLWNMYDNLAADTYDTVMQKNFDSYSIPKYDPITDTTTKYPVISGNFNPANIQDPFIRNLGIYKVCEVDDWDFWNTLKLNVRVSFSKAGGKAVQIMLDNEIEPKLLPIDIENVDGTKTVMEAYAYVIKSMTTISDVPDNLILAIQTTGRRGKILFNDVYELLIGVRYLQDTGNDVGLNYKIRYRMDIDRSSVVERVINIILGVIYFAAAVILSLVTFGVGGILLAKIASVIGYILLAVSIAQLAVTKFQDYIYVDAARWASGLSELAQINGNTAVIWGSKARTALFKWINGGGDSLCDTSWSNIGKKPSQFSKGKVVDYTTAGTILNLVQAAAYLVEAWSYFDSAFNKDWDKLPKFDKWVSGIGITLNIEKY